MMLTWHCQIKPSDFQVTPEDGMQVPEWLGTRSGAVQENGCMFKLFTMLVSLAGN